MSTYIILLRGVNVGGNNLLPMKDLKAMLQTIGFENVRTYIQSGNIILDSYNNPENSISALVSSKFGIQPEIVVLSEKKFSLAVSNNPFQEYEGKYVHFYFCKERPKPDSQRIEAVASETETFKLVDNVFYVYTPDGVARSKLIANIEKCLGVAATGRNLNTVTKLSEMLRNS